MRSFIVCFLTAAALGGCGTGGGGRWTQFHADGDNAGFRAVHTGNSLRLKWATEVGAVVFSSPVLGPGPIELQSRTPVEVIYIGTADGELVAVGADGAVRWRSSLALESSAHIVAAPGVGRDGSVYVITTRVAGPVHDPSDFRFHSTLHRVNRAGILQWSLPFPANGHTTSSPKPCLVEGSEYIIVGSRDDLGRALLSIDEGGSLIGSARVACEQHVHGGRLPLVWHALKFLAEIFEPFEFESLHFAGVGTLVAAGIDPTIAVSDDGSLVTPGRALLIAPDACGSLQAFEWSPSGFVPLWTTEATGSQVVSSPVLANGLVFAGFDDGRLRAFDGGTGDWFWEGQVGSPVMSTAASFGRHVFVTTPTSLYVFDPPRVWRHSRGFAGNCFASPALSLDRVYVSTTSSSKSYSFDLRFGQGSPGPERGGGTASPAIGSDGTIYMVTGSVLRAYETPTVPEGRGPRRPPLTPRPDPPPPDDPLPVGPGGM